MNLSPLQKLDKVLEILHDYHTEKTNPNIAELLLKANDQITLSESHLILNKLIADKYAVAIHNDSINALVTEKQLTHKITFDGLIFIEYGGYVGQNNLIKARYRKEVAYTISVGIGTALAGLYGLLEIFLWFWHHFHHC